MKFQDFKGQIAQAFPNLGGSEFEITSPPNPFYNCIAWAAGDPQTWWWPDSMFVGYWPESAPREVSLLAFQKAFESLGYSVNGCAVHEPGIEKIALFVGANGKPTHASRQIDSRYWTSKLGDSFDISHPKNGVNGDKYGQIALIMGRPVKRP